MKKPKFKSQFLSPLDGRWIDDKHFMLLANLEYRSIILGGTLEIPVGFVTDFASVPRLPIIYNLFGNRAHHESVPHDYLYQKHEVMIIQEGGSIKNVFVSRDVADSVFLEAMKVREKKLWMCACMFLGVRIGGSKSYSSGSSRYKILNPDKN
jgi:hypothetical protein